MNLVHGGIGVVVRAAGQNGGRRHAAVDGLLYVVLVGGKEQVGSKRLQIRRDLRAAGQRGARNIETVMGDGIENAQARVRAVARHDDHFHQPFFLQGVQVQKRAHQLERGALGKHVLFVLHLIGLVFRKPLLFKNFVFLLEVEKRPRADADYERFRKIIRHAVSSVLHAQKSAPCGAPEKTGP